MHNANHQKHRLREDVHVEVDELITIDVEGGKITEEGVRKNTSVALKYISEWLQVHLLSVQNLRFISFNIRLKKKLLFDASQVCDKISPILLTSHWKISSEFYIHSRLI